jgi:DNA-binding response OmpR family regulator
MPARVEAMKILLIDDDALLRRTVARMLGHDGHDVMTAPDGATGITVFRRERPDLVITDMVMPVQQGCETILEIRRDDPTVKIIAISGGGRFSGPELLDMARLIGADDAIEKPFRIEELLGRVRALAEAPARTGDPPPP